MTLPPRLIDHPSKINYIPILQERWKNEWCIQEVQRTHFWTEEP